MLFSHLHSSVSYTFDEALSLSFGSAAATLALVNLLIFILIFGLKSTSLSRLIVAFLVSWYFATCLDFSIDLLFANRLVYDNSNDFFNSKRIFLLIQSTILKLLIILYSECFNWSLAHLILSLKPAFKRVYKTYVFPVLVLESLFALFIYILGVYEYIQVYNLDGPNFKKFLNNERENTAIKNLYLSENITQGYILSSMITSIIMALYFFVYYHLPKLLTKPLTYSFKSGSIYLLASIIIHVFFSVICIVNEKQIHQVRLAVLGTSMKSSFFIGWIYCVSIDRDDAVFDVGESGVGITRSVVLEGNLRRNNMASTDVHESLYA